MKFRVWRQDDWWRWDIVDILTVTLRSPQVNIDVRVIIMLRKRDLTYSKAKLWGTWFTWSTSHTRCVHMTDLNLDNPQSLTRIPKCLQVKFMWPPFFENAFQCLRFYVCVCISQQRNVTKFKFKVLVLYLSVSIYATLFCNSTTSQREILCL